MLNKIRILIAAAAVAGSTSSAFAVDIHHRDHGRNSRIERYSDPQLSEGRNSGLGWGYSMDTSRESLVDAVGN